MFETSNHAVRLSFFSRLISVFFALTLSACQTLPSSTVQHEKPVVVESGAAEPQADWRTSVDPFLFKREQLLNLNRWQYSAKLAITTEKDKEQANLVWRFDDQANQLRLFGPLGSGQIKLEFDQYGVVLSDSKGVLHQGDSASKLLRDIVGWPIPIDALDHWLFAMPQLGHGFSYLLNEDGSLNQLKQFGWTISYKDYRLYPSQVLTEQETQNNIGPTVELRLPRKITAVRSQPGLLYGIGQTEQDGVQPEIEIRLVAKQWKW